MSQTAAHLVDHVIPHVPVRQWVLSLPIPLRLLLAAQPELVTPVLQVVQRVLTHHLLDGAQLNSDEGHGGAVTLIQRFGSAANLNIHLHCLVLDGVYRCGADGLPTFVEVGAPTDDELHAPTDDELHALLQTVITRLMKMLSCRGVLIEEMGQTYLAEPDADGEEARTLRPLQAAANHLPHRLRAARRAEGADPAGRDAAGGYGSAAPLRRHRRFQPACGSAGRSTRPQAAGTLLKRVFDIDMQHCPNCGAGELKVIAAILEPPVIQKILGHLGLDPQPPPKALAREPGPHLAA